MKGLQRLVRRAILPRLKADLALTALVPVASINPAGAPTWPFIVLRAPVTQRLKAACVNGGQGSWDIHAFAGQRLVAGTVVETAEDHAGRIGAAIEMALADNWLALPDGAKVRIRLSDIRLLQDGDPDHYHWFAQINWRVLST
ncbi:DUF3168 domain-containing protein [Novosphingobium sp. ES2-1]|uniref:DUF3168 domain-containing protein n=1 Tax=Novosphingobium sp. ES2-1 TaxID=2780074 RepID=UPI001880840E|nr:DUF3168 domain-containing protein [Novosphingobium sp. ES2-1]QOV95265.1 DUF3168 domain-containing protein [Novosphingobium sp. ES2-1]